MEILILEDERMAAERLVELLAIAEPGAKVAAVIETVEEATEWIKLNPLPDLVLSDIQLADGLGFEVFQRTNINVPVIFTTAYDAYTLKAFKLNSVDYLLKPIDIDELKAAIAKFHLQRKPTADATMQFADLIRQMTLPRERYKSRFLVRQGERLITIPVGDMAFVQADDKVVFLHTNHGQKFIIEDPLEELVKTLDPDQYFRLNRTYIAPLTSIDKIQNHFNGRLKVNLRQAEDQEIFVSRARVAEFKKWLNR